MLKLLTDFKNETNKKISVNAEYLTSYKSYIFCKTAQQLTDKKYSQKGMVPYTYKHIKVHLLTFCMVRTVFRTVLITWEHQTLTE